MFKASGQLQLTLKRVFDVVVRLIRLVLLAIPLLWSPWRSSSTRGVRSTSGRTDPEVVLSMVTCYPRGAIKSSA